MLYGNHSDGDAPARSVKAKTPNQKEKQHDGVHMSSNDMCRLTYFETSEIDSSNEMGEFDVESDSIALNSDTLRL